jgi:hypothetical protein
MNRLMELMGIDKAIATVLLGRLWGILSGIITIIIVAKFLTPVEQGFYYSFSSILAFQMLFELGMGMVITQFASHEMAFLNWSPNGILDGDIQAKSRLYSLLMMVMKWYGFISILFLLCVLPFGWIFFTLNSHDINVSWQLAWGWLVLSASLNILLVPLFAILEGCGRVAEVAKLRMAQNIFGSCVAWLVFTIGGGLLAMSAMNTAMFIITLSYLLQNYTNFFRDIFNGDIQTSKICWKSEIWPFQWKVAITWISGFFIVQTFVPILFAYRGALEAGQMGMSLSISAALASIGTAWMSAKAPKFGNLIVLKRYQELDTLFSRTLIQSALVVVTGGIALLLGHWLIIGLGSRMVDRILPALPFGLLIATVIVNHIIFAEATYMRSHKVEPFMWLTIVVGLLVALITLVVGKSHGATGMMLGYFLVTLIVGLGWGTWIFLTNRLVWHGAKNEVLIE